MGIGEYRMMIVTGPCGYKTHMCPAILMQVPMFVL